VVAPEPGTWRLQATGSTLARITVIADLQLEVDPMPNNLPAGQHAELGLRLREGNEIISDAKILQLFALRLDIEGPADFQRTVDVSADYPVPGNGEYRVAIAGFEQPGRYLVTARLEGKTLRRQVRMYVQVTPTAATPSISTRGDELPPIDFRTPALVLGGVLLLLTVLVSWYLRRRRQRRLELWRRRSREVAANDGESGLLEGLSAPSGERKKAP
jgi:hypothetical protein